MKKKVKNILSIILYIVAIIIVHLPWFLIDGQYRSLYEGYAYVKKAGVSGIFENEEQGLLFIKIQVVLVLLCEIISICYILTVILKKNWHLNIIALILALGILYYEYGLVNVSDNVAAVFFPLVLGSVLGFEFLLIKLMDVWDDAVNKKEESTKRDHHRKEEEKRRLSFPGRYTELFYQMVWKNFKYDWKDYSLFLLCSTVVSGLSLAGIGCYQMMSGLHRDENFLIGQGLGLIVWNAMIPLGVCTIFLMVFILIFYLQKWMESYSIFVTLGIRRKALYIIIALEILIGFLISVLLGCVIGNGILALFRQVFYHVFGEEIVLSEVTIGVYLKMLGIMVLIYIISLMATRDIMIDFNLVTASTRRIRREKMPDKRLKLMVIIGCILSIGSIILYTQLNSHETIYLLCTFFAGVFLLLRYGGAAYLRHEQNKECYVIKLLDRNHLYHRSKTATWYQTALIVLYICALFYFTFQIVSASIAEEPETLFPYDFVCIADDGDNDFFADLEENYEVEISSYPMVRVSNADKTEEQEGILEPRPQGQQIGISETTFHQLKKELDDSYQAKDLKLDKEGERVYIVHQQDRSVRAQPIDWTYWAKKPFLHIGLPCPNYRTESPSKAFTQREIAGEEIGSLIGCFRQGNLENIVVFSDEYFAEAQEMWKYTNIYNGDPIEDESLRIEDVTIHQGPTKLVLIKAKQNDVDALEQEMQILTENHAYEASFDGEVESYYSKKTAISDMETEHIMKQIVNLFVLIVLLMTSAFLIYVKTLSEMDEKIKRAGFLKCMGMRRRERIRVLKGEVYLLYWMPAVIATIATLCFTAATFHARMYTGDVIKAYLEKAVWIWLAWILIEGVYIFIIGQWLVRKVEGKEK